MQGSEFSPQHHKKKQIPFHRYSLKEGEHTVLNGTSISHSIPTRLREHHSTGGGQAVGARGWGRLL